MSVVICVKHNKDRPQIYNKQKKVIKKPKVTNETIFYHIIKSNKHDIFGTGIFIKSNMFNTKKQLFVDGKLYWFKNKELKMMKNRKMKKENV